jgi:endo-1,4-beta-D-glucanase Y
MFPFPQNRESTSCTYPAYSNADVTNQYTTWKTAMVTTSGAGGFQRVQRPNNSGDTVSEAIGYGMLISVYMNDQSLFDDLWQYEQQHLDGNGLMNWQINAGGSTQGSGSATDGDEDMAWALIMASHQWGTSQKVGSYSSLAATLLSSIWNHDVSQGSGGPLPGLGDSWYGSSGWPTSQGSGGINVSYFAPAYYRVFAAVDTSHNWKAAVDTVYSVLDANLNAGQGNATNGLVPGFSLASGQQMNGQPYTYQYDACRTPFRVGLDWCFNAEPRAQQYLAKIETFFSGIGIYTMQDGYNLNGTPSSMGGLASPFLGPLAVGGMSSTTYTSFVSAGYKQLTKNLMQGGEYYAESWTTISLLMLSGNFLDYTKLQ